jgi:putative two-component system response regulator
MENTARKNILAVDDEGESLAVIRAILRDNYNISIAKTSKVGFQVLESTPIDLILLDIRMPDMNGFEFAEKLRQNPAYYDIPIMFVTESSAAEFISRAIKYGAQSYILKPINPEFLLNKIKELFENA